MDIKIHATPSKLERYSFLWSLLRLLIAAVSLIIGGYPIALRLLYLPLTSSLLTLSWIISGIASVYLAYRWNADGRKLFGGTETKDTVAFFAMVISGVNLGLVGLIGQNIGMNISSSKLVFIIVGVFYVICAYYLHTRWKAYGEKIF